jgi:hypothetical protein
MRGMRRLEMNPLGSAAGGLLKSRPGTSGDVEISTFVYCLIERSGQA